MCLKEQQRALLALIKKRPLELNEASKRNRGNRGLAGRADIAKTEAEDGAFASQGPVTHQPATGASSPSSPLAQTTEQPLVMIGGVPASVQFSGLTPGYVGLYQVNAQVLNTSATGNAVPVVISIGGAQSDVFAAFPQFGRPLSIPSATDRRPAVKRDVGDGGGLRNGTPVLPDPKPGERQTTSQSSGQPRVGSTQRGWE